MAGAKPMGVLRQVGMVESWCRSLHAPPQALPRAFGGWCSRTGTTGLAGCSPWFRTRRPTTWFCSMPREALGNDKVPRRVQQQGQIVRWIVQGAKQKGKGRASDRDLKIQCAKVSKEVKQLQSEIDKEFKQYMRLGGHTDGYFRALHLPSLKPPQRQLAQRAITGVKETPTVQAHAWVSGLERLKKRAVSPSAERSAAKRARGASSRAVSKVARAGRPRSRECTLYNIVLADLADGPQTTSVATSLRDDGQFAALLGVHPPTLAR